MNFNLNENIASIEWESIPGGTNSLIPLALSTRFLCRRNESALSEPRRLAVDFRRHRTPA